jgi:hypothetical protein
MEQNVLFPNEPITLPNGYKCPKEYAEALVNYVEKYRYLIEIHFVDFITLDHWNLLSKDWQRALLDESDWFDAITSIATGKYKVILKP